MTEQFGLRPVTDKELNMLNFLPQHLRDIIIFHRDFDTVNFQKERYFVYTGRGPSRASLHIGHLPALRLCLALQNKLTTPIQFMIADDEKIIRDGIPAEIMKENVSSTIEQLRAIGFDDSNTVFRINSNGIAVSEYSILIRMLSMVNIHTLDSIFGKKDSIGDYFYPLIQILPCMTSTSRCIVVAGVDQDPFFRLARDIARRMGFAPPIILYTRSVPGLDGSDKMSTSVASSIPIYLTDGAREIAKKISKIRKIGAGSLDELFQNGADLTNDVPYQLLRFFDESDKLSLIAKAYTIGVYGEEVALLRDLVGDKCILTRNGKVMLTSSGIRIYLTQILQGMITI